MQKDWIWQQTHALKDIGSLRKILPWLAEGVEQTTTQFQFQITPYYLCLLDPQNPQDPLAKICVPQIAELDWRLDELADPIGDRVQNEELKHSPTPAIVHRYADRCLLFLTPLCSSYCRYCFRREIVAKPENTFSQDVLEKSFQYIEQTHSLREVILSGGDPLLWGDQKLEAVLKRLESVEHLRTLRFHTRFPVFNPYRITDEFVEILSKIKKPLVFMLHIMHPKEISEDFVFAIKKLKNIGVTLLNQSVLIKDCNDNAETLKELSYRLMDCGIVPQYLHIVDRARGTSHFRVSIAKGQELLKSLHGQISGYMIPQLMLEIPGGYGKISVDQAAYELKEGGYLLRSPHRPDKVYFYQDSP
jgi:lysine 2,3-aminomutase